MICLFFFTGTLYFLCGLVFRKYAKCPQPGVSLHQCVMALSVNDSPWCLSGVSDVSKRGDLGRRWLSHSLLRLRGTAVPVHIRLLIKGIFLPVL